MARILERSTIEEKLKQINWEYVSPEFVIIHEDYRFIFKNPQGNEIEFSFTEVWNWLYDINYIGCGHDCQTCLTPIC